MMLDTLFYYISEFFPVLICLLPFFLVLTAYSVCKKKEKVSWRYLGMRYLWTAYLIFVLFITGAADLLYTLQHPLYFRISDMAVNLIPFVDFLTDPGQYFANILLFVPFGLLFPLVGPKRNLFSTFLWGIGFSFSIELLQMFSLRTPDLNDLLMNGFGVLLGYLLFVLIRKIRIHFKAHRADFSGSKWTALVSFLFAYAFLFLYDFLKLLMFSKAFD